MSIDYQTIKYIEDCIKIHGNKYDYSLVNYVNTKQKISVICKFHGIFETLPGHHKNGVDCAKCIFFHIRFRK